MNCNEEKEKTKDLLLCLSILFIIMFFIYLVSTFGMWSGGDATLTYVIKYQINWVLDLINRIY